MTDTNLNDHPAYQKERKPIWRDDFIDAPVFDADGDVIQDERIYFACEQFNRDMVVYLPTSFVAHRDDVTNMIQDLYKNFNIEYK
jgi:hypothetical protein